MHSKVKYIMHNAVQRRCVETYSGIARFSLRQHGILSKYASYNVPIVNPTTFAGSDVIVKNKQLIG